VFACGATSCRTKNDFLATARGRVGYAVDRWMPYVTAGLAIGDIRTTTPGFAGIDQTNAGWTVGGGVEFAVAGNNHSVKVSGQWLPVSRRHARDVRDRLLRAGRRH